MNVSNDEIDRLERDIEESRRRIGDTLDMLQDRLAVRDRARRAMWHARDLGEAKVRQAISWSKQNPRTVAAGLVALPMVLGILTIYKRRRVTRV